MLCLGPYDRTIALSQLVELAFGLRGPEILELMIDESPFSEVFNFHIAYQGLTANSCPYTSHLRGQPLTDYPGVCGIVCTCSCCLWRAVIAALCVPFRWISSNGSMPEPLVLNKGYLC